MRNWTYYGAKNKQVVAISTGFSGVENWSNIPNYAFDTIFILITSFSESGILLGNNMNKIALYPSSTHLLPTGRATFTFIEKRYLGMLKAALAGNMPFAICMINESEEDSELKQIPAIATQCKVINFDQDESGFLSIVVEGTQKIRLHDIKLDDEGLMQGEYTLFPNWDSEVLKEADKELAEKLKLFYQSMPEIGALYSDPQWKDISWVCQRWIEVLPLEVHYKQLLVTQDNAKLTTRFLHKLFHSHEN